MKLLVTGAGSRLARSLAANLSSHDLILRSHRDLDIADPRAVEGALLDEAPDAVINTAAFNDVDGAEGRAADAYRVNASGPRIVAIATARAGIPIVHLSTDYVFDGALGRPYVESDRPNPLCVYGASKLEGEAAIAEANPRHHIVRTAWLYDERTTNYVTTMCDQALAHGRVKVVDDQFGSPTYLPHLVRALEELLRTSSFGIRHLAGAGTASRLQIVESILRGLGIVARLERVALRDFPAAARRPAFSALATEVEPRIELPHWSAGAAAFVEAAGRSRQRDRFSPPWAEGSRRQQR